MTSRDSGARGPTDARGRFPSRARAWLAFRAPAVGVFLLA